MAVALARRFEIAREPESATFGRSLRIVGGAPVSGQKDVGKDQVRQGAGEGTSHSRSFGAGAVLI